MTARAGAPGVGVKRAAQPDATGAVAWLAEADCAIVATSGLVFVQRPPYPDN